MNNIPIDKCLFCNEKLLRSDVSRQVYKCPFLSCKMEYIICFTKNKNELICNGFQINNHIITNYFNAKITFIRLNKSIQLPLVDWDYSSVEKIKNKLKLILTFQ